MAVTNATLKKILVDSGILEAADFESVAIESEKTGIPLETLLPERKLIPDDYLGQLIADELGYPYARLDQAEVPDHVLRIIPERVARKKRAVAFEYERESGLKVAMRRPEDLEFVRSVEKRSGVRVLPHYVTSAGIQKGLDLYTKDLESAIRSIKAAPGEVEGDDGRTVRIVELIMDYAYQNGASDIHIEPREENVLVRYRIDGILHDVAALPRTYLEFIVTRIKIMAKMRTDEHFAAQDGKFQETVEGERMDVRVSILPIVEGEKVVMRLLTEKGKNFDLDDVGLSKRDLKILRRHTKKSFGMILSTGPTGSGKTTTLYAALKELNSRDVNIATIEDPIEYAMEGVNQIQVNVKTGLTFASGLRSIVRQDPDIVMVGEIRDPDTAGIAVNAAMTGHLVLSTLHTNDAATALPRFREMGVETFLIASTINVIVAQRLVRKICKRCIMSVPLDREQLEEILSKEMVEKHLVSHKGEKGMASAYRGKGCDRCQHTGYSGRIGIFEVLELDDQVRELVMQNANSKVITQKAIENGMTTMLEDGLMKVKEGITTIDEVLRVTGES